MSCERRLVERTAAGTHEALFARLPMLSRDRPVLDMGCGTGAWLERLADAGFSDLTGIDGDGVQFGGTRARLIVADLSHDTPDLPPSHFALISAIEVIEHMECPGHFLALVARYLAPDGAFLLSTPNIHSLRCRLRYFLTGRMPAFDEKGDMTHIHPVLFTCLERMLTRHGLQLRDRWTFPARGTRLFRFPTRILSAVARLGLRDELPGDALCLLIGHAVRTATDPGCAS